MKDGEIMNNEIETNKIIKTKIQQCGLTQKEFAKLVGLSESEISKIKNGHKKIDLNCIAKLSKVLKFTENEINTILNICNESFTVYDSYASELDNVFTNNEVFLIENLDKSELIKLKNYIYFLTNKNIAFEDKEAINILVKTLNTK